MTRAGEAPDFKRAVCRASGEPYWDLEVDGETKHQRVQRHARAKALCGACPLFEQCREWANVKSANGEQPDGIWGGRVYAPDAFKYPRCARCDRPLATTMTAVWYAFFGYAMPHPQTLQMCVECGQYLGCGEVPSDRKIDGVRRLVEDPGLYVLTGTITQLEEARFPRRRTNSPRKKPDAVEQIENGAI